MKTLAKCVLILFALAVACVAIGMVADEMQESVDREIARDYSLR
jgi:hypothetical protein